MLVVLIKSTLSVLLGVWLINVIMESDYAKILRKREISLGFLGCHSQDVLSAVTKASHLKRPESF